MKCPHCTDSTLVMADKQGIEIDYCPACRGIWLDRGELDKLLERSVANTTPPPPPQSRPYEGHEKSGYHTAKHYRKKSWLEEIFD